MGAILQVSSLLVLETKSQWDLGITHLANRLISKLSVSTGSVLGRQVCTAIHGLFMMRVLGRELRFSRLHDDVVLRLSLRQTLTQKVT